MPIQSLHRLKLKMFTLNSSLGFNLNAQVLFRVYLIIFDFNNSSQFKGFKYQHVLYIKGLTDRFTIKFQNISYNNRSLFVI